MLNDMKIISKNIDILLGILATNGNIRLCAPEIFELLLIRLAEEIKKGVERQEITAEYFISLSNKKLNKIKNGIMENNKSTKVIRKEHPELIKRLRESVTDLKAYTERHPVSNDDFTSIYDYFVSNDTYLDFLVECLEDDTEELKSIIEGK